MYNFYGNITEYFSLKKANSQLATENAELLKKQLFSFIVTDNKTYTVDDTLYRQQYHFITAKVISNSTNRINNYITLNKGYNSGIKKNMGVITTNGIVGIVKDVSANFSSVTSVLHSKSKISAKLKKGNNIGTIIWNGGDYTFVTLKDVPTHVKILPGDTVISSGYSLMFPEGIPIGKVHGFTVNKSKDFYEIQVKLFLDINNISYVYVVNNLLKEELSELEKKSQDE